MATRSKHKLTKPWLTVALLVGSDLLGLALAGVLSIQVGFLSDGDFNPALYWKSWPMLGLFVLTYAAVRLYPGVFLSPADELRRTSLVTTLLYLVLGMGSFASQGGEGYAREVLLGAWGLSLVLVPLGRSLVRQLFAHKQWWGYPVVILGAGETGELIVRALQHQPTLGLKPIAVPDDDPILSREFGGPYAILAMPGVPRERLADLLKRHYVAFRHLLFIPDLYGFSSLRVTTKDVGGVLGLEVCQQPLAPGPLLVKRLLDLTLTLVGGTLCLPLVGLICLLIRLDSPGPIFYANTRIGRGGRRFQVWKFRTMVQNAEQLLQEYLYKYPELRREWEKNLKLKHDPRITRMGWLLRWTSLDELPQLWNVLRGDMSLVGPRPILPEEVRRYGQKFELYIEVLPGLTGMWQVAGRNDISYEERGNLVAYYVLNWSIWLDLSILIRTVWAVLFGRGAY